jgi:hypothetical protein
MRPVDIQDLFNVSRRLEPLGVKFAFTGGAIVGFLLDIGINSLSLGAFFSYCLLLTFNCSLSTETRCFYAVGRVGS